MQELQDLLKQYWGYDEYRPLQAEAIACVMQARDSVVVLPTGGGKSLCFQLPAVALPGMAVVVSPLISLMKDQVDQLTECGIAAACINSAMTQDERVRVNRDVREGRLDLLYVSPERVAMPSFIAYLRDVQVSFVVVDEAHCISQWGHDFRPEYRELSRLRDAFPDIHMHAYTATATEHVRADIARELHLHEPEILVGSFDRPNLTYRVRQRQGRQREVRAIIDRHAGEAGIVYCIRRSDVDSLCMELDTAGYRALPYHAGLDDEVRKANQEAFIRDETDIIVATVAFGMGIDKPNVRYVIHAGMPKSVEHYQQESGRAGRDGLEAECCLLFTGGDYGIWKYIVEQSEDEDAAAIGLQKLNEMYRYCTQVACRHRALLAYFDETYAKDRCGACDFCLDEVDVAKDSKEVAAAIFQCVSELGSMAGPSYTALVLCGSTEQRVTSKGHDNLASYGVLADRGQASVRGWIEQLAAQGYMEKVGEYHVLQLTPKAHADDAAPRLAKPVKRETAAKKKKAAVGDSWEGVDEGLFEALRKLRHSKAQERGVPAYVIFGDKSLRDMARKRPTKSKEFMDVHGVGRTKCKKFGDFFIKAIREYCTEHGLEIGPQEQQAEPAASDAQATTAVMATAATRPTSREEMQERAGGLFAEGHSIEAVGGMLRLRPTTVENCLERYIAQHGFTDPSPWVDAQVHERVREATTHTNDTRLKHLFQVFDGEVTYRELRISLACLRNEMAG